MAEPVHREDGDLAKAREVFLAGCGLPNAWAGAAQWRVLEMGFGRGLNFLLTWQAWRDDPARPGLLHFVATEAHVLDAANILRAASAHPALHPLAEQLAAQWQGLLPGTHRLVFEGGRVLLTLGVGDAKTWLKAQHLCIDSVYLDDSGPQRNPASLDAHLLKAVARCCRRGSRLATRTAASSVMDGLQACGFAVQKTPGLLPEHANLPASLQASFNPAWEPKTAKDPTWPQPRAAQRCVVIGAGLAGAACAASLARRGWAVTVLDAHAAPASGASGLPAGLLAPHVSSDDGVLSRLSRSGLRATWGIVAARLAPSDWQAKGVLQRRLDSSARLPAHWPEAGAHWSKEAEKSEHGPDCSSDAQQPLWHAAGGWVRPARLVEALLQTPGVQWRGGQTVAALRRLGTQQEPAVWQVLDASGECLAEAELIVVAAGPSTADLLATGPDAHHTALPLQPVRGQVIWGAWPAAPGLPLPATPVNGLGGFIPAFTPAFNAAFNAADTGSASAGAHWLMGATFERGEARDISRPEDTQWLRERLHKLWPAASQALASTLASSAAAERGQSWVGVRCVSPDRLPLVGPLNETAAPGLWVCTAMGSRGLTFAVLCAELLAGWLHAEPLPLEKRLAQSLLASRFNP